MIKMFVYQIISQRKPCYEQTKETTNNKVKYMHGKVSIVVETKKIRKIERTNDKGNQTLFTSTSDKIEEKW